MNKLDPHRAPDLFAVDAATLAQEMNSFEVVSTAALSESVVILAGHRNMGDRWVPAVIVKTGDSDRALHVVALPGGVVD